VFPWSVIRDATAALQATREISADPADDNRITVDPQLTGPTVRQHGGAGDELILVSGGEGYLKSHAPEHGCLAWIMDRQGDIKHVWKFDPSVWEKLERVKAVPLKRSIFPMGLHLDADGGLLVSFLGRHCFPYGIGLARFDKDSNLVWKQERFNHHWFSVAPDGRIFCPSMRLVDSPYTHPATRTTIASPDGKVMYDVVMTLDAAGNVLDEIPVLDALIESGWTGLLRNYAESPKQEAEQLHMTSRDPTHLNDVRLVDAAQAARHPQLKEGDLLVSFRNLNALGVLDPATRRFKWMSAGAAILQHSPRITDRGILLFDNLGGAQGPGGSRLVEIDLVTGLPRTVFPVPSVELPGEFYTEIGGYIDLSGTGKVLATLQGASSVWEIDLATGAVVWDYTYVDPDERCGRRLYTAQYVRGASFLSDK
jgi:hypothetical protein